MPSPPRPEDAANTAREVFDPPTHSPVSFLAGTWSTIYSNHTHREQMEIPNILPGMTLGLFHFNSINRVRGEFRPNVAGKVRAIIAFDGTYNLFRDEQFGLVQGFIVINLPGPAGNLSKNSLFFVARTVDELDWVLMGSDDPTRVVVAGGKMFRIQPVPFEPLDGGGKGPENDLGEPGDLKP